jgi:hypothetical protein
MFFALMVSAPRPPALPPRGAPSMFFNIDGGAPGSPSAPPGAHRRCFLTLIVGAPGSPTPPPKGLAVDIFSIDGGRSRISVSTSQGSRRRHFLVLMMGAPGSPSALSRGARHRMLCAHGSPAPPPRVPAINVFSIDGGCSRTSGTASPGARHRCF